MKNKEQFLALVSEEKTDTLERNKVRIKNRAMLRESQNIAIKVLMKLDELSWSQKDLAKEMQVSPQQITKIVSGKENLTIETQIKLQNILNIPILASFYENQKAAIDESILTFEMVFEKIVVKTNQIITNYQVSKPVKTERHAFSQEFYQLSV